MYVSQVSFVQVQEFDPLFSFSHDHLFVVMIIYCLFHRDAHIWPPTFNEYDCQ